MGIDFGPGKMGILRRPERGFTATSSGENASGIHRFENSLSVTTANFVRYDLS